MFRSVSHGVVSLDLINKLLSRYATGAWFFSSKARAKMMTSKNLFDYHTAVQIDTDYKQGSPPSRCNFFCQFSAFGIIILSQ